MRTAISPGELFERALERGRLYARSEDGARWPLPIPRWLGRVAEADARALARAAGPVLDIGCGPGRHVLALSRRGVLTIGIDIAPAAVRRARDRGAAVMLGSIFDPIASPGRWRTALLLDGNIGIGGRPVELLRRVGELLSANGEVLCELDPPGRVSRCELIALEDDDGVRSSWFAWARVGVDEIRSVSARAGFVTLETWQDDGRWFSVLVRATETTTISVGWLNGGPC